MAAPDASFVTDRRVARAGPADLFRVDDVVLRRPTEQQSAQTLARLRPRVEATARRTPQRVERWGKGTLARPRVDATAMMGSDDTAFDAPIREEQEMLRLWADVRSRGEYPPQVLGSDADPFAAARAFERRRNYRRVVAGLQATGVGMATMGEVLLPHVVMMAKTVIENPGNIAILGVAYKWGPTMVGGATAALGFVGTLMGSGRGYFETTARLVGYNTSTAKVCTSASASRASATVRMCTPPRLFRHRVHPTMARRIAVVAGRETN